MLVVGIGVSQFREKYVAVVGNSIFRGEGGGRTLQHTYAIPHLDLYSLEHS